MVRCVGRWMNYIRGAVRSVGECVGVGLVSIYMYIQAGGGVVIMWVKVFDPAIVANIPTVNSGTVKHVQKFLTTPPNLNAAPTNFIRSRIRSTS